ncbi:Lactonase, 7-bladed beta-propeller-domain-containing protein [Crucibulum laeve]|uniref:Lactonase, 7-bladed beta-propeller-domain-containing protein n=1 Tax=Crucibulum laeve TaxID=68775 RepID=A0A5C3LT32_9AGAR|nr:Lactonase, 7-bladed beta-propeller-domain-containing protein [Crucibulum laeve]
MVNFTILSGGFSAFIATYVFDSDTSTLTLLKQNPTGQNPSWIASHQQNTSILYAVNEVSPVGSLQSFTVDQDGGLTLVDTVTSGGSGPTFTNLLSTGEVSAMNFGSPNSSFVATIPDDPIHFARDSPVVDFPVGDGPSNPHMSLEFNGEVFVPDLGADKIWRLVNDGVPGKFKVQGQIDQDAGSGPRHIAIQDNILFTIHEKTSTLTAQAIPSAPNGTTLPLIANVSIVPSDVTFNGSFFGAEILISEPTEKFPDPLIYVSNRNLGPEFDERGDTIAIFEFKNANPCTTVFGYAGSTTTVCPPERREHTRQWTRQESNFTGSLTLLAQVFTGLKQIRSMSLGRVVDGGDEFLIAGANVDGGVVVLRRIDGGRNLTLVTRNEEVANRTSFVFI